MAKLTGAAKKAFLERMAKGRRKAARANPKRKAKAKTATKRTRKAPKKKAAQKGRNPLRGKAKAEFLRRMARGRAKAKRATRKTSHRGAGSRKTKNGRRRNQSMEGMFETFHGQAPKRIVSYDQLVKYPDQFAELGKLLMLKCDLDSANRNFPLERFGDCKVVCTPDGRNIYFIGGDQSLDLAALDIGGDKDLVELGPCGFIEYYTTKDFHDFEPTKYWHLFGEENGIRPVLAYDRINKTLFLLGGDYRVERPGIVN